MKISGKNTGGLCGMCFISTNLFCTLPIYFGTKSSNSTAWLRYRYFNKMLCFSCPANLMFFASENYVTTLHGVIKGLHAKKPHTHRENSWQLLLVWHLLGLLLMAMIWANRIACHFFWPTKCNLIRGYNKVRYKWWILSLRQRTYYLNLSGLLVNAFMDIWPNCYSK